MGEPLKLRAVSSVDLALISGLLQDALVLGADMTYNSEERRFVAVVNRFCWEQDQALEASDAQDQTGTSPDTSSSTLSSTPRVYHRTHAGLVFDRVRAVQSKNIDLKDASNLLNLLSVHALNGQVELLFSGAATIRLKCTSILAHLKDLGEPWPTQWRPHHGYDEQILAEETARESAHRSTATKPTANKPKAGTP